MAPASTSGVLWLAKPRVMMRPSPGPATSAAIVAVAHSCTSASRTPVRTTGIASGSSTVRNTLLPRIPMPRAASTTSRSTSVMPT